MRVIFVGIHNKPQTAPLCSSTKSGKLVDRVIAELKGHDCLKSNLWNVEYFPAHRENSFNYEWVERVQYQPGDIVITLGEYVRKAFVKSNIPFVHVGHPSACWSHEKQDDFILNCLIRIEKARRAA